MDFRQLVRDLASVFRTRIELRQIGVRDEAKMMGGMGCCGRPLCCATFLDDFVPVSIRMAKEQNLSLNPTKISGICGRLMCCLKYESEGYGCGGCMCMKKKEEYVPAQNDRVVADEGEGRVVSVHEQRRTATILLDDGKTLVSAWEDIVRVEEDDEGSMRPMPAARAERPLRERGERRQRPANRRRERGERGERSDRPPRPSAKGEGGKRRPPSGRRPRPQQRSPRPNSVSDE